jgi:nucleoside-diphosphate-sugar epimerase
MTKKTAVVCGGGGFIGSHLVKRLKSEGFWVRAVDIKFPEYEETFADDFIEGDLRDIDVCNRVFNQHIDEVYQLAADMGGAGFVFTGENDAEIMHNSATINLNVLEVCRKRNIKRIFYSSSACMYPEHNQMDPDNPICSEDSAYPANPDSEYGWEKLFSERLFLAYGRNHGMTIRVGRYHNIFGTHGTWEGGREKAPAALCRKVCLAKMNDENEIEMWGEGDQTRSFLYVDECVEGTIKLMRSDWTGPVNIGSEEMVSINELAEMIMKISGNIDLSIKHIPGPLGVRGRNSDNRLIKEKLGWAPSEPLSKGLKLTYAWIQDEANKKYKS